MRVNEIIYSARLMIRTGLWLVFLFSFAFVEASAKEYYVSPKGAADAKGKKKKPFSLQAALSQPKKIKPGDTIWLREGVYSGSFVSDLMGTESDPIKVIQYPGERAIIDGAGTSSDILTIRGGYTYYQGFEVKNSQQNREPSDAHPHGVFVIAPGTRLINLVVHDTGLGIAIWQQAINAELYGNIIYNNGWFDPAWDRGSTGYGIYTQNDAGIKTIQDNLWFNNYSYGFHAYGKQGPVKGYLLKGNAAFNNGAPAGIQAPNIFFGHNDIPIEKINVTENFTYQPLVHPDGSFGDGVHFGLDLPGHDIAITSNYLAGGRYPLVITKFSAVTVSKNIFYGLGTLFRFHTPPGLGYSADSVDNNSYFGGSSDPFSIADPVSGNTTAYDIATWKRLTGFDADSSIKPSRPSNAVFVRSNKYEQGRANIIIYNWNLDSAVDADVSGVLSLGQAYEVRNAQDYFGAPVLSGKYEGGAVRIPMKNLTVASPVGRAATVTPSAPEFGAFVLLPR